MKYMLVRVSMNLTGIVGDTMPFMSIHPANGLKPPKKPSNYLNITFRN